MKTLILLTAIILMGCEIKETQSTTLDRHKVTNDQSDFVIVEIEGCEYIRSRVYNGYDITHKGNCKFCKERSHIKNK